MRWPAGSIKKEGRQARWPRWPGLGCRLFLCEASATLYGARDYQVHLRFLRPLKPQVGALAGFRFLADRLAPRRVPPRDVRVEFLSGKGNSCASEPRSYCWVLVLICEPSGNSSCSWRSRPFQVVVRRPLPPQRMQPMCHSSPGRCSRRVLPVKPAVLVPTREGLGACRGAGETVFQRGRFFFPRVANNSVTQHKSECGSVCA